MDFFKRRRQGHASPFPRQAALQRGAMLGGLGNSLIPFSPHRANLWGSPLQNLNRNRRRHQARFPSQFPQAAYGHPFARPSPLRGFGGPSRMPFPGRPGLGSYPGGYRGGFPRRPMHSMHSPYRMGSSAYRNPYMGSGFGGRQRPHYGRPSWNTPLRRAPMMRRGFPPTPRRHDTYPTQWYDDTFSDEEEDGYGDNYDESDYEDTYYRSPYGRQRNYQTDYDESDDEDDDLDDDDLSDEEEYDLNHDQHDRYGSGSYGAQQYRGRGGGW